MSQLKIIPLSAHDPSSDLQKTASVRLDKLTLSEDYIFTQDNPDVLFFLSGGTERMAMNLVSPENFYVLIGSRHNNAFASATEVKAWLNERNIPSLLLDEEEPETTTILNNLLTIKKALENLKGQKLGQIGQVSDWLISSEISAEILREKLGVELCEIPWNQLTHFSDFKASASLLDTFSAASDIDLKKTGQVNELLTEVIQSRNLDAITVECFPMVQKDCVTACLPLAKFNDEGIPAGCEGDLTAIAGMMLCKELTGTIPWIANVNKVSNDVCMFSHCTIAPGLVSDFSVKTHFETGLGTAVQGDFKKDLVTIFRFDRHLSKAFIATATITGRPKSETACRTQIEVKLTEKEVDLLRNYPLGNHHLIFPGDCKELLQLAFKVLDVEVL